MSTEHKLSVQAKCQVMSRSKLFWLVILLVVIITAGVAGVIFFFAFEKKVIFSKSRPYISSTVLTRDSHDLIKAVHFYLGC